MTKLQEFLNSTVDSVTPMHKKARQGDLFGIELECEGVRVDWDGLNEAVIKDWAPHHDGSLRAHHGSCCEWVFNGPVKYDRAKTRVDTLFDYFKDRKANLVCSNRTSTHIHFNMGDKHVYQLVNMFILFTILEDIMDRYCGEDRNGNLFCLSSRHAEEQIKWVQNACFSSHVFRFGGNQRYTSLNLASLNKFGTVEFRGMRGLDNKEDILDWLDIVKEFCDYACYTMRNPATLVEQISVNTPVGFLKEVFSEASFDKLTHGLTELDINQSIYEGLRLVQMLCYKIGTEFDQVRVRGQDFWASLAPDEEEEAPDVIPRIHLPRVAPGRARLMGQPNPFFRDRVDNHRVLLRDIEEARAVLAFNEAPQDGEDNGL